MEARGLVYKVRDENNAKILHLYPTEEGVKLSTAHKLFDNMDIMQTSNDLLRSCTAEEIDTLPMPGKKLSIRDGPSHFIE